MTDALRGDIREAMARYGTRVRTDISPWEVEIYARSLIGGIPGEREYRGLTLDTHLYADLGWNQLRIEEYREALNEFFGIELPRVRFFCARTVRDVKDQVLRVLAREGRAGNASPPAA
ncbi:MAG TPA: hypothetical protein VK012_07290 [Gemmatimonadales bacterium]|nr:hypothetical protein [Gemmatimonadales bacterium]